MNFIFLTVFAVFTFFSHSQSSCKEVFINDETSQIKEAHERVKKAVWTLHQAGGAGTVFFISPNQFVTNFHVVKFLTKRLKYQKPFLSQNFRRRKKIEIKQIVALSALHDLALVEIEQSVDFYLKIGKTPPNKEDDLFIAGNRGGISFHVLKKTSPILYSEDLDSSNHFTVNVHDRDNYLTSTGIIRRVQKILIDITNNSMTIGGMSGSPVYDTNGQVVGVLSRAMPGYIPDSHLIHFRNLDQLRDLISGEQKLNCKNFQECIKEEQRRLELYAENGNPVAQTELFAYRFKPPKTKRGIKKVIDLLEPLAQKGQVYARLNLATAYSGIGDDESAFYWLEKLARQGYPDAQHEVRDMYLQGIGVNQDITEAIYWRRQIESQAQ